ncbi:MAG TPA: sugar-binding transcriptional regulator [Thiolinea sp.]|nr:sugar-binding transcriptional regulator [Thiolinea sp.]
MQRNLNITPPLQFADDFLAWAVWLYYVEGRTQNEVAKSLGVSRTSVANYLAEARRRGMVSVTVAPELLSGVERSTRLSRRYGLRETHIIPARTGENREALTRRLGGATAQLLSARLNDGLTLGVAWGRTVLATAQALTEQQLPALKVVQVAGSSVDGTPFSPEYCTALFANRLGARCYNFHAPGIVSNAGLCEQLMHEPIVSRQFELIHQCDLLVFGVAAAGDTSLYRQTDLLNPELMQPYLDQGAEALVLGRILDAGGREMPGPLTGRQLGLAPAELSTIPQRFLIAGGADKYKAIRAILAGGYATHLITDQQTAQSLEAS